MTSQVILLLGTPQGRWREIAGALWPAQVTASRLGGQIIACADVDQALAHLDAAERGARLVVFVESPARAVAAQAASDQDRTAWVSAWLLEAGRLLRLVQRCREQCLVIDTDAAIHDMAGLSRELQSRLALEVTPDPTPPVETDVIAMALASRAIDEVPGLRRLCDELQACCDWPAIDSPSATTSAWAALRELRKTQDNWVQQGKLQDDAIAGVHRLEAERDGLREQLALFDREVMRLTTAHAEANKRLADAQAEWSAKAERARSEATAARHSEYTREHDTLVAQNHATQEALEQALLKLRAASTSAVAEAGASAAASGAAAAPDSPVVISGMRPTGPRDERPHREITWLLRHIEVPGRSVPSAEVRLVEHHGRPGLVIMNLAAGPQLLRHWQETGREENRPYMLLIPGDPSGLALLASLDSLDWMVLLNVGEHILRTTSQSAPKLRETWLPLARRLLWQLQELPPVWRHGAVRVSEEHHGGEAVWRVVIEHVHHGRRYLPQLTLLWQPLGRTAGLALLHPEAADAPLAVWPEDDHDAAAEHLWLPLRGHAGHRADWRVLSPSDREFALQAAVSLPPLLASVDSAALPGMPNGTWQEPAQALAREARRLLANGGLPPASLARRIARRVLRRA